ncbi:aldehyde dehydrogenase [Paenisporosarcina sp. TG20]|uniref:aldehyde dehydrogenase n=1 Tax=Paenisporosarcina sp. TG20 TaxID=1211706 RepID=UPI0002E0A6CF|nr:aldehyde dehydrogenase [Paenisporosarcina sp. TG20]
MNFTAQDVENMIQEQHDFYYTGATKSIEFRMQQLHKLKKAIQQHEPEILLALYKDLRKSEFEAYATEVGFVLDSIGFMSKHLDEWMKPESVKTPLHLQPAKSFIVREPYGSALIIGPFNYPFQLVMEPLIGAIIGGNCAIVKPSESAVHTAAVIRKVIESTFSPNYIRVVEGEREETTALIHAPFDTIFFTGSVAVGKIVMKAAAERLTPVTLELGGKSPAIIDHTANLEIAAKRIVWGKFVNAGQTCVAPDYLLVQDKVKEQFIKLLKQTIKDFYGKDAQNSPDYGRIINNKQFNRLKQLINQEGQHIVAGGNLDENDSYIEPTLLDGISWNSPSMEDEIFGPILPILTYESLETAIQQVRKLPKPLAAYLFSENDNAIQYFLEELPFGGGCINDTVSHVGSSHMPFGGVGSSGMNGYHGKYSFEAFTHAKSILKKSTKISVNIAFPPYKNKVKLVKSLLR